VDNVFVSSLNNLDVLAVVIGAEEFFNHFFMNFVSWNKELVTFQLDAWVCIYGISLHALCESFFKLCIMDCGRYLKIDSVALEKEQFD